MTSNEVKHLILSLLCDRSVRLGQGDIKTEDPIVLGSNGTLADDNYKLSDKLNGADASDIKSHPWFTEVDWGKLEKFGAHGGEQTELAESDDSLLPPFQPNLDHEMDTRHFEEVSPEDIAEILGSKQTLDNKKVGDYEESKLLEVNKKLNIKGFSLRSKRQGIADIQQLF